MKLLFGAAILAVISGGCSSGGAEPASAAKDPEAQLVSKETLDDVKNLKGLWDIAALASMKVEDTEPTEVHKMDGYEPGGEYIFVGRGWIARVFPGTGEPKELVLNDKISDTRLGSPGIFPNAQAIWKRALEVIKSVGWDDPKLVGFKISPFRSYDKGGITTKGPIHVEFGYEIQGVPNQGAGNHINIMLSGTTGECLAIKREKGWRYSPPKSTVSLGKALEAAMRADLGKPKSRRMGYVLMEDTIPYPRPKGALPHKVCAYCYIFTCPRGEVAVSARSGLIASIHEKTRTAKAKPTPGSEPASL